MELEASALRAAPTRLVDKSALTAIPFPNGSPNRRRDIPGAGRNIGLYEVFSPSLRLRVTSGFKPFELLGHRGFNNRR
jgi:hypothetical protein